MNQRTPNDTNLVAPKRYEGIEGRGIRSCLPWGEAPSNLALQFDQMRTLRRQSVTEGGGEFVEVGGAAGLDAVAFGEGDPVAGRVLDVEHPGGFAAALGHADVRERSTKDAAALDGRLTATLAEWVGAIA